jgi:tRNA(fMet)-specific endonuclease VapC
MADVTGYCVDSDILIDYLRGLEAARTFLLEASQEAALYISIVSVIELYAGRETKTAHKRKRVDEFLSNFEVLDLTFPIAQRAGTFRRDYQQPFADMIVAATASEHGFPLVTRNTKHFHGIKALKLVEPY